MQIVNYNDDILSKFIFLFFFTNLYVKYIFSKTQDKKVCLLIQFIEL